MQVLWRSLHGYSVMHCVGHLPSVGCRRLGLVCFPRVAVVVLCVVCLDVWMVGWVVFLGVLGAVMVHVWSVAVVVQVSVIGSVSVLGSVVAELCLSVFARVSVVVASLSLPVRTVLVLAVTAAL